MANSRAVMSDSWHPDSSKRSKVNMPDGNLAALRSYESSESISELCALQAEKELYEPAELADAIAYFDKHHEAAVCLARCFRNLDAACRGETISQDAITTALHNLFTDLVERRTQKLVEEYEG